MRRKQSAVIDHTKMLDDMFGFIHEIDTGDEHESSIPVLEKQEDISDFQFTKFAATYFQVSLDILTVVW